MLSNKVRKNYTMREEGRKKNDKVRGIQIWTRM